ncbi:pectinesterase QRT1-like isoform X2 [Prosopis cineraria]|uniref:pectinesterase QRT1-like isoform X2 n=1 Tax=Prosopis cineraria TaxID=364024 RepID=UPI00240F3077|nr:pectinesterase QRT1-like isoform X2 [Prosopis cineraria]
MIMGLSSEFRVLALFAFVISLVGLLAAESGDNGSVRDYITWDDLTVDENSLASQSKSDLQVIVVDQNGNGHSSTVQGAVDMVPDHNTDRVKIYISPGTYREKVFVPKNKPYVSFIGKRNQTHGVVITWNSKSSDIGSNGQELGTYGSATVAVESDYFCANRITFENSVVAQAGGRGMQGVALRVDSERAMFYKVKILGTQDTLLDNTGTHYFLKCFIQGKVDFICGSARSFYEDCRLKSTTESYGAIAAHHRDTPNEDTGFSFVGCSIQGTGLHFLESFSAKEKEQIEVVECDGQNLSPMRKQSLFWTETS